MSTQSVEFNKNLKHLMAHLPRELWGAATIQLMAKPSEIGLAFWVSRKTEIRETYFKNETSMDAESDAGLYLHDLLASPDAVDFDEFPSRICELMPEFEKKYDRLCETAKERATRTGLGLRACQMQKKEEREQLERQAQDLERGWNDWGQQDLFGALDSHEMIKNGGVK